MIKSGLVFQTFHLQIKSMTMGMRIMKSLKVMKCKQVNLSSIAMQSRLGNDRQRSFYVRQSVTSDPRRLVHAWGEWPGGEGQDEAGG